MTVDGKPLFLVYHPMDVPEIRRVTDFWRELAVRAGLAGLYLVGVSKCHRWNPHEHGFDASVTERLPGLTREVSRSYPALRLFTKLTRRPVPTVYSYREVLPKLVEATRPDYHEFPVRYPQLGQHTALWHQWTGVARLHAGPVP